MKPGACARPKISDINTTPLTSDLKAAAKCDWTRPRKKNSSTNPASTKSQTKQSGKTNKKLKGRKVFASKRGAATAGEVLEAKESSAYHQYNWQMTAAQRAHTFVLNPEIANSITETESKDRKRNDNENQEFLSRCDERVDPRRIDPMRRKMLVNPLWTADQVKRYDHNVSDEDC